MAAVHSQLNNVLCLQENYNDIWTSLQYFQQKSLSKTITDKPKGIRAGRTGTCKPALRGTEQENRRLCLVTRPEPITGQLIDDGYSYLDGTRSYLPRGPSQGKELAAMTVAQPAPIINQCTTRARRRQVRLDLDQEKHSWLNYGCNVTEQLLCEDGIETRCEMDLQG